ncbi:MAG: TlpA disulfide reductase family protein [Alphaproteobacteria bacterium]
MGAAAEDQGRGFQPVAPPRPLPALDLTDAAGQPAGLDAYRGKVVLVNFWATWCGPCVEELPALSRLQARLSGPDFTVIAVSGDRTGPEAVTPFLGQHGITGLPVLYDRTLASGRALHVTGLPTSILLDRDGREVGRVLGTLDWDSQAAVRPIEDAIKGRAPESG